MSGDSNRQPHTATLFPYTTLFRSLVGAPTGHVGIAPSRVGEVHPQPDPSAAGRRPGLVAVVGIGRGDVWSLVTRSVRMPSSARKKRAPDRRGTAHVDVGELAERQL